MEVMTSAVHSAVGFLHLQVRSSSHVESKAFFVSTARRNAPFPCNLHPNHLSKGNNSKGVIVINSTSATTTTSTATSDGSLSEVEKIKQRCLIWRWKGQHSINYFVSSSDSEYSPQQNHPPLLLVHGFGASIPHWRRYVAIATVTIHVSTSNLFCCCCCFLIHPFCLFF